jgi:predicted 3-demethylubiquinone-9 3-methyltransferase (glyoxalase superfamily)
MRIAAALAVVIVPLVAIGCQATHSSRGESARTTTVTPFLMFQDGRAEEAINRYVEVFGVARVISIKRYGPNSVGAKEDAIEHAVFEIHCQRIGVTESPPIHAFGFTPSISLFVDFTSEKELDRVFAALSDGGEVMMPPDNYGFSRKFAFIQDRYGVSWQLNLPSEPSP